MLGSAAANDARSGNYAGVADPAVDEIIERILQVRSRDELLMATVELVEAPGTIRLEAQPGAHAMRAAWLGTAQKRGGNKQENGVPVDEAVARIVEHIRNRVNEDPKPSTEAAE